jgi:hypothetical protein
MTTATATANRLGTQSIAARSEPYAGHRPDWSSCIDQRTKNALRSLQLRSDLDDAVVTGVLQDGEIVCWRSGSPCSFNSQPSTPSEREKGLMWDRWEAHGAIVLGSPR